MAKLILGERSYRDYVFKDRYKGLRVIGEGGFATAVLCADLTNGNLVVVKVTVETEEDIRTAARKEAELLSRLDHPNVIKCIDFFTDQYGFCLVMEFAPGGDFGKVLDTLEKEGKKIPPATVAKIFAQIMLGLRYMHLEMGIIHRDLKPSNMFLFPRGVVKLGDLGISRELRIGELRQTWQGTPGYAAPELYEHIPYSFEVDIWSAGALLWELVTLRPAYTGLTAAAIQRRVLRGPPDRPKDVDRDLIVLSERMMSLSSRQRPGIDAVLGMPVVQAAYIQLALDEVEDCLGGWLEGIPDVQAPEPLVDAPPAPDEDRPRVCRETKEVITSDVVVDPGEFNQPCRVRRALIQRQLVKRLGTNLFMKVRRIYRKLGEVKRVKRLASLTDPRLTPRIFEAFECLLMTELLGGYAK